MRGQTTLLKCSTKGEWLEISLVRLEFFWIKKLNKWRVNIHRNNVSYYLGLYSDFKEAVKVREAAELKYFGFIKE